jgi:ParB-like nuclease domain
VALELRGRIASGKFRPMRARHRRRIGCRRQGDHPASWRGRRAGRSVGAGARGLLLDYFVCWIISSSRQGGRRGRSRHHLPSDRNARTHSRKQIKQIAASIKRFGFTNPILIDDDDRIIAGHGRVAAAKLLRLSEVPTIRLSHLSAAEKRAYILADNRLAEKAGWDPEILAIELQGLIDLDFQVELTGFEVPDVDIIVEGAGKVKAAGPEDDIPAPSPGATVSRPGDMWVLGGHRLLCADARENAAYVRLLNGEQAQFVFTHPPPNFAIADAMSPEIFTRFLANVFSHLVAHTTDGSIHQICKGWRHIMEIVQAGNKIYSELEDLCVWNKKNAQVGSFYRSQHELVFVWKSGSAEPIHNLKAGRLGRTNVWDYAGAPDVASGFIFCGRI